MEWVLTRICILTFFASFLCYPSLILFFLAIRLTITVTGGECLSVLSSSSLFVNYRNRILINIFFELIPSLFKLFSQRDNIDYQLNALDILQLMCEQYN